MKYNFAALLAVWGIFLICVKLFIVGLEFPFLTIFTIIAIALEISKSRASKLMFLFTAGLWIIMSAETIGFVLLFDASEYGRIIIVIIPLVLSVGLFLSVESEFKWLHSAFRKLLIILFLLGIGLGSYIYKPTIEEVNVWYYFEDQNSYNVRFAHAPDHTFEVRLSSEELKEQVKNEGLQYEGTAGYYCPETKVRVVTCFGEITSVKILSFRNSEIDIKVLFKNPIEIPLDKVRGKLEILEPLYLRIWN